MRGKTKKAKKSFGKFHFFPQKKNQRDKKKENKSRGWRSKIKSLYPHLVARKQFSQEKLTTGKLTRTVCLICHRDNSDHEVYVSSLSNKHFEKKSFSKKYWYSPITWLFVENKKQRFSGKYFGKKEANHKRNFADGSEKNEITKLIKKVWTLKNKKPVKEFSSDSFWSTFCLDK